MAVKKEARSIFSRICPKCGKRVKRGDSFCGNCGFMYSGNSTVADSVGFKTLRCSDCGGVLKINEDRSIASCPYCGGAQLVVESDFVKVEKYKIKSKTDVQLEKIKAKQEMDKIYMDYAFKALLVLLVMIVVMVVFGSM